MRNGEEGKLWIKEEAGIWIFVFFLWSGDERCLVWRRLRLGRFCRELFLLCTWNEWRSSFLFLEVVVGRSNWNGSAIVCYLFLRSPLIGVGLLRDATRFFETQCMAAWMFRGHVLGRKPQRIFLRVKWLQKVMKGVSSVRLLGLGVFLSRIFPVCFAPSGRSCKNRFMRILKLWWQIALQWLHNYIVIFCQELFRTNEKFDELFKLISQFFLTNEICFQLILCFWRTLFEVVK